MRRLITGVVSRRVARHVPEIVGGEKQSRIVHVVAGQHLALHLEQILGIPEMLAKLVADLAAGLHGAGKDVHPRLQHRVLHAGGVERHRTVVGIHGRLDRVPDVGDLLAGEPGCPGQCVLRGLAQHRALGVRVVFQCGVTIDDPYNPAVDHGRIGIAVDGEPRRDRFHPLLDPAGR